jgi:hypothetical protein
MKMPKGVPPTRPIRQPAMQIKPAPEPIIVYSASWTGRG